MKMYEHDKKAQTAPYQDMRWEGGCTCGEIRYVYEGRPVLSLKCHCLDCQAWSGAGHLAMFWAWREGARITTGAPHYYVTQGDSGKFVQRGLCPRCGVPVTVEIELIPSVVGIIATSLDSPERFMPEFEIWTKRAPSWDPLDYSLQHFESGFDRDVISSRLKR
jgi:hypothetical protein